MYGNDHPHRVPDGETDYLAKAGKLLDKVAEENERDRYGTNATRERLAAQYAILGAIQRGVLPTELAEQMYDLAQKKQR